MMLMVTGSPSAGRYVTAVFLARIVMPFSRSRSIESMTRSVISARAWNAPRLPQHGVDEGGLAVVDVGDDGDVAEVGAGLHVSILPGV